MTSSPALSSTITTSESSSSAASPSTFPTSQPTSPATTLTPPGCRGEQIHIGNKNDLDKIGNKQELCANDEDAYPANGKYIQTANIDAGNNHDPIKGFTGDYNGNGNSISNLNDCLFKLVDGGKVRNLVIQNASVIIDSYGSLDNDNKGQGVVVCKAEGKAQLKNNTVEDSNVKLLKVRGKVNLGMLAGEVLDNTKLEGNQVRHSSMSADIIYGYSDASVGILTGTASDSEFKDNAIDYCQLTTDQTDNGSQGKFAGLMAGEMCKVKIWNSCLTNNRMVANTKVVVAGGVAGKARQTTIEGTRAINNTMLAQRGDTNSIKIAVIIADALNCTIRDTIAMDNELISEGKRGSYRRLCAGIVTAECHSSTIENTLAKDSDLSSKGNVAVASAHDYMCNIRNTTARNITITARAEHNKAIHVAAIAKAEVQCHARTKYEIKQTTAIDCRISAEGINGYAAVGVGFETYRQHSCQTISDTTACNTTIKGNHAGIVAGYYREHSSTRTRACNTTVNGQSENPDCSKANCLRETTDAPATQLTTATTTGSNKTTTDFFNTSPPTSSPVSTTDNVDTSSLLLNADEVDAGIPLPAMAGAVVAGILTGGIILYASYQWYQGYQQGLRGTKLALRPITCIKDAIFCHAPAMGYKRDSMELVSLRSIDV
ncbi:hypothetical protein [Endozoicomonas sp. ALB115]|uniref:hypothetical protein n=1 Tax=Endozoicomonas sp. ALB115 TaxID=3403074 RepID=UPI003BB65303